MNLSKNTIRIVFFLVLAIFCVVVFSWWEIFVPKNPASKETKIFPVIQGEGSKDISNNLEKQGIIKSGLFFRTYTLITGSANHLQAGKYEISSSMNIPEIVYKISLGDVAKFTVTFPEGFSLADIEKELEGKGLLAGSDLKNQTVEVYKKQFSFFESVPDSASLEGFLFPDTYQFAYGTKVDEIVDRMISNFNKKLTADLRDVIVLKGKSIFEIITMASLIEKEVRTKEDKELVSGILWKRIEIDMPLQVDATIRYFIGKKTGGISVEDTQIDSPYNTYKYKGLPKGPICNPGLESIKAAIYPKESDYLYYLSTPEGETIFNKTFEKHKAAKEKYL